MNYVRKPRRRDGEDESVQICIGRDGGRHMNTYCFGDGDGDVLTQLRFIAIIHVVNNVRSSQPSTLTA